MKKIVNESLINKTRISTIKPFVLSLSKHERLIPFDKLRAIGVLFFLKKMLLANVYTIHTFGDSASPAGASFA